MSDDKDLHEARASMNSFSKCRGSAVSDGVSTGRRMRELLSRHGIRLRKSLGQNFLLDDALAQKLAAAAVEAARWREAEVLVEVGAGLGALTVPLAQSTMPVFAFEIDTRLAQPLREVVGAYDNIVLYHEDFLPADLHSITGGRPYVAAGNLPYQITSPLLEKIFADPLCRAGVFTVQKEFAQRLRAVPGTRDYSTLTLFCRYHVAEVERICSLPPQVFLPPPGVVSEGIRMIVRETPPFTEPSQEVFMWAVRAAFGHRRKSLTAALGHGLKGELPREAITAALEAAGLDGSRRAETLDLDEFAALALALNAGRSRQPEAAS